MTTWFTDRVEARAVLARRLAAKGEAFLRQHYLHPADLEVIATQGEAAKEADREQQVQLAEGAQARAAGRDRAAEVREREAALSAMRRDIDAAAVTVADVDEARNRVRPSLDPAQVADLKAYAERRLD